jgi:hypothetical protein
MDKRLAEAIMRITMDQEFEITKQDSVEPSVPVDPART